MRSMEQTARLLTPARAADLAKRPVEVLIVELRDEARHCAADQRAERDALLKLACRVQDVADAIDAALLHPPAPDRPPVPVGHRPPNWWQRTRLDRWSR